VAGVYYRPPGQGEPIDEAFYSSYGRLAVYSLSFYWEISTTPTSARQVAQ